MTLILALCKSCLLSILYNSDYCKALLSFDSAAQCDDDDDDDDDNDTCI